MEAVLMVGGAGQRLQEVTGGRPKPLVLLANRPILAWTLEGLARRGFRRAFLCVGADAAPFRRCVRLAPDGLCLEFVTEDYPRGTIGALALCPLEAGHSCLVMNGDVLTTLDCAQFLHSHEQRGDDWSIAAHRAVWRTRFGEVDLDGEGWLTRYREKPEVAHLFSSGVYAVSPAARAWLRARAGPLPGLPELLPALSQDGLRVRVVPHAARWVDINDADDLCIAARELKPEILDAVAGRRAEPPRSAAPRFGERGWQL